MNNETAMSAATMLVAGLALFLLVLWTTTAAPAGVCLSKKEARELWPKKHIYWYSKDRCWSNRRGPPRHLKIDPIIDNKRSMATTTSWKDIKAQEEPVPVARNKKEPRRKIGAEKTYRWDEFNPIDAQADNGAYFYGQSIELWPSVMSLEQYTQFGAVWDRRTTPLPSR